MSPVIVISVRSDPVPLQIPYTVILSAGANLIKEFMALKLTNRESFCYYYCNDTVSGEAQVTNEPIRRRHRSIIRNRSGINRILT